MYCWPFQSLLLHCVVSKYKQPQSALERVDAVVVSLMKLVADHKKAGAGDDELEYYRGIIDMLTGARNELLMIDEFIRQYKVQQKIMQYMGEMNLNQESTISILKAQLAQYEQTSK